MQKIYDYLGNELFVANNTPEQFGAIGNGIADDTSAVQSAVNCKLVTFAAGKTYKITSPIRVKSGTFINMNGSTISSTNKHAFFNFDDGDSYSGYSGNGNITIANGTIIGGCVSFIHGRNIRIFNVNFKDTLNDHFVEICECKDYVIDGCSFSGMTDISGAALEYINIDTNATYSAFPHNKSGQSDQTFYDLGTNKDITIRDCAFSLGEGQYAYGFNAIGVHSRNVSNTYAEDVVIVGNMISGFTGCGLRINAMNNAFVANNKITVAGDGIRVGDVADVKNVVIQGNYVTSSGGAKIAKTSGQFVNLTVSGNVTEGDTQDF